MLVAGITMVRNEKDVIEFCIEHHLAQGLDYIYICDNGSIDGTYEYLLEKSQNDSRVVLIRELGDFHQQAIINSLSNMAYQNGCEWVVPFDADELWFSPNTLKVDLANIFYPSIRIEMKNFVQSSKVIDPKNNTYLNTKWRLPDGSEKIDLNNVVNGTSSIIENPAFYKYIVKTSPTLSIAPGAHSYTGQDPDTYIGKEFDAYHIPIRSYRALQIKAEQGQRLIDAGYNPGHGWHVQRYANLNKDGLLYDEWLRNSEIDGKITRQDGTQKELYFDDSVAKMYDDFITSKGKGKITAVIRTIGRATLPNAINSALKEFDDVIVVADRVDLDIDILPIGPTYLKNDEVIDLYGGMCINIAANECVTEYLCLLDDDDEYVDGAGDYMRDTIINNSDVDVWIPGLKYNDGLYVCMEDGLKGGNVAVPTYKTKVLREYPFKNNNVNNPGLTDFYHVQKIFFAGHKVDWYKKHLYNVRPQLPGRLGQGKR
jgi:glycosyltransferase involved in cell wall biosynthesis